MKKFMTIQLSLIMLLLFAACGSDTQPSNADNTSVSSQQEENRDDTEEKQENDQDSKDNTEDNQNVSDKIGEVALKDVEDTITALAAEYEKLVSDIDTYDKYMENTDTVEAFYNEVCEETKLLCIRVREYSISYAEFIMSSDKSNDDKYDEFDEIYDYLYDDAGDEIYDEIYDGILDEIYDDFYDGILDDAYDDAAYEEWSDCRTNEYEWWSDSRSDVYEEWSDYRSDVYEFWSDMKGELWDDDIEKVEEKIEDFRADIEKIKGGKKISNDENSEDKEEENTESITESSGNPANNRSSDELVDGMRPEFKEAMDSYEAFYDKYCDFMKKYAENPTDLELIAEYADMVSELAEMDKKFQAWGEEEINEAEAKYYLEVNARVAKKLLEVAE